MSDFCTGMRSRVRRMSGGERAALKDMLLAFPNAESINASILMAEPDVFDDHLVFPLLAALAQPSVKERVRKLDLSGSSLDMVSLSTLTHALSNIR